MNRIDEINKEFQIHAGQPWTARLTEVIAEKDKEVEAAKEFGKKQTSIYLNMEEQRNNLRKKLEEKNLELEEIRAKIKSMK